MRFMGAGGRLSFYTAGWVPGGFGRNHDLFGGLLSYLCLDFWGFGESGKKRDSYSVQDFVSLVDQFMERLGIECARWWAQHGRNGQSIGGSPVSEAGQQGGCGWFAD